MFIKIYNLKNNKLSAFGNCFKFDYPFGKFYNKTFFLQIGFTK